MTMRNKVSILLGEVERELLFNFGTLKHIKDITGGDPLLFTFEIDNYESLNTGKTVLIYAGLLSACDSRNAIADFTKEDVGRWTAELTMADLVAVIGAWAAFKGVEASGEGSEDTR